MTLSDSPVQTVEAASSSHTDSNSAHPRLPRILSTLIERLDAYLDDPAAALPSLTSANDSPRQQRLERRLACVQLLRAHIRYMDLASMRVGVPQRDGSFLSFTLRFLAKKAGLGLRRAERAMKDLLRAGLVRSQSRCERTEDGEYRGLAALRQLPPALFGAFGLSKWLGHERSKAVLRRYRAAAATAKADRTARAQAQGTLILNGLGHRLNQTTAASRRTKAAPSTANLADLDIEARRRVGLLLMQHPEWDRDTCYTEAYRELRKPR